jgi:hypothetical protein
MHELHLVAPVLVSVHGVVVSVPGWLRPTLVGVTASGRG